MYLYTYIYIIYIIYIYIIYNTLPQHLSGFSASFDVDFGVQRSSAFAAPVPQLHSPSQNMDCPCRARPTKGPGSTETIIPLRSDALALDASDPALVG